MENEFNILKADDDKHLAFGWANVAIRKNGEQIIDYQGDIFDPEDLEEAAYKYVLNFRDAGEEHIPSLRKKAKLVESVVFTKEKMAAMGIPEGVVPEGWWIGFYVHDEDTWQKIKNGTYRMFSIEGAGIREEVLEKSEPSSLTFKQLLEKFNPWHDERGRFTSGRGSGGVTFSANPKTADGRKAIMMADEESPLIRSSYVDYQKKNGQEFHDDFYKAYDTMTDEQRWRVGTDYGPDDYGHAKCFTTAGGSTIAIKEDGDIVSVCKAKGDVVRAGEMLQKAVDEGGTKLDAFGENLYNLYTKNGFEPVSQCRFVDEYAPEAWIRANGFKPGDKSWHGTPDDQLVVPRENITFFKYTGKKTTMSYEEFAASTDLHDDYGVAQGIRDGGM